MESCVVGEYEGLGMKGWVWMLVNMKSWVCMDVGLNSMFEVSRKVCENDLGNMS